MDILKLYTLGKIAHAAYKLEKELGQERPLNFKVGETSIVKIMDSATAENFVDALEHNDDLERVLTMFSEQFVFIPLTSQEEYIAALADLGMHVVSTGFRFPAVCPEVGDEPIWLLPVSRTKLNSLNVRVTANIDPQVQEAFESVEVTEGMSPAKYQRKLIQALRQYFGEDAIDHAIWNEENLQFTLNKLPMEQYGFPLDEEEGEE